jgi:hypothetical protein
MSAMAVAAVPPCRAIDRAFGGGEADGKDVELTAHGRFGDMFPDPGLGSGEFRSQFQWDPANLVEVSGQRACHERQRAWCRALHSAGQQPINTCKTSKTSNTCITGLTCFLVFAVRSSQCRAWLKLHARPNWRSACASVGCIGRQQEPATAIPLPGAAEQNLWPIHVERVFHVLP